MLSIPDGEWVSSAGWGWATGGTPRSMASTAACGAGVVDDGVAFAGVDAAVVGVAFSGVVVAAGTFFPPPPP